jgi:hypothetical protein
MTQPTEPGGITTAEAAERLHAMLFAQRHAYGSMGSPRRVLHRFLYRIYTGLDCPAWSRPLWWLYRQTWPRWENHDPGRCRECHPRQ